VRTAFIQTLHALAAKDTRIWLLTGDLGFSVLEPFARDYPERFVNCGVAEQNMMGVAAGLALCGKVPFVYSIANFPVMRCLEQIRDDVCYHELSVKIVAVGGGLAYGSQGYTHYGVEDLAVLRALPGMVVLAPGDPVEARLATKAVVDRPGPCYIRLGKSGEKAAHLSEPEFAIGKAIVVREGRDVALLATGGMLNGVLEAAGLLESRGVTAKVLSVPTIQPLDEQAVRDAARGVRLISVVEEHSQRGGLSDAVARCLSRDSGPPLLCLTLDVEALLRDGKLGCQSYLCGRAGLSPSRIAEAVIDRLAD
jgi:transketolase